MHDEIIGAILLTACGVSLLTWLAHSVRRDHELAAAKAEVTEAREDIRLLRVAHVEACTEHWQAGRRFGRGEVTPDPEFERSIREALAAAAWRPMDDVARNGWTA